MCKPKKIAKEVCKKKSKAKINESINKRLSSSSLSYLIVSYLLEKHVGIYSK